MNTKIKIFYNTFIQILGRFFTSFVTYFITLLLVRQYGTVGFGEFVKIITYVSYFYIMADFGLNAVVVKKMTEDEKNLQPYLSSLMGLRIILSLVFIFVSVSLLAFLPQGQEQGFTSVARLGIILGSLTILTQSLLTTTNAYFQKTLRYDKSVLGASLGYLLTLLIAYLLTKANMPIALISLSYVVGGVFSVIISFLLIGQKIIPSFSFPQISAIFRKSWPLGLTLVLNLVYFKSDSFILALTRSTAEVGVYGLAYKFFEMTLVVPTFFMNSMYPLFLEKLQKNNNEFWSVLKNSGIVLLLTSLLATIILFVFAPVLINFTSGSRYLDFQGGILALRVLSLSLPFFFLSGFLMWLLITRDKQTLLVPLYATSMIFNIVLNILLIPKYGYLAAAFSTGISEVLVFLLLLIPSWKLLTNKNSKTL